MMDKVINKRKDLYNFFYNDVEEFDKEDILRKEFSVLTFSPHEEYIDMVKTDYDDKCIDLSTLNINEDIEEIYIKGIIIDVDNKKNYAIIHVQNKSVNLSISCSKAILYRYDTYLEVGTVIIARCHTYCSKIYMDFMIDVNFIDNFKNEIEFLMGKSKKEAKKLGYNKFAGMHKGLICQLTYFISAKKNQCKRLEILTGDGMKMFIACKSHYNKYFEDDLVVGDFISFQTSDSKTYINNVRKIQI